MNAETAPVAARRKGLSFVAGLSLLYGLLAIILAIVGVRVWQSTYQASSDNEWVAHTYQVEGHINGLLARLGTLQTDAIGYAATGDPARLARFNAQTPLIDADLRTLTALVADNPQQHQRATELSKAVEQQRERAALVVAGRQAGRQAVDLGNLGFSTVRELAHAMLDEEDKLLLERSNSAERAETLTRALTATALGVCFLFLVLTYWLVRSSHARSIRSRENLRTTNVKLFEALENANSITDSMTKLSQLGEMLQSCRSLDEMRAGIGGALTDLLPDLGGRLALISPSQNLAAVGAHWGRHGLIAESVFAPEDCWALRRGQPYPLAGTNSGFVCKHVDFPNPEMPHAGYLCVPLSAQGEVIGVLTFDGERAPSDN